MTKPARKEPVRADIGTKERRARGDVRITGPSRSDRQAKAETSVERIAGQRGLDGEPKLTAVHIAAAKQYYECAVAYGVFGRVTSVDFSKEVFGGGDDDGAEWLEDRKRDYLAATRLITKRYSPPMVAIILHDATLTQAGRMMGGRGPNAGAPVLPLLKDTLDRLADYFKIRVVGDEREPT